MNQPQTTSIRQINIAILTAVDSIENCSVDTIKSVLAMQQISISHSKLMAHIDYFRRLQVLKSKKMKDENGYYLAYRLSQLPFEATTKEAILYVLAQGDKTIGQVKAQVDLLIGYKSLSDVVAELTNLVDESNVTFRRNPEERYSENPNYIYSISDDYAEEVTEELTQEEE